MQIIYAYNVANLIYFIELLNMQLWLNAQAASKAMF